MSFTLSGLLEVDWKQIEIEHANHLATNLSENQIKWLHYCLPVIVQPKHDFENNCELIALFVAFEKDSVQTNQENCTVIHIYKGESSYHRKYPLQLNRFGSFLYRSYNYLKYGRTSDVNMFQFKNINYNFSENKKNENQAESVISTPLWESIWTPDHAGNQAWSTGDKGSLLCCYSFDYHYNIVTLFEDWELYKKDNLKNTQRPLIYLNTHNHMIGSEDNNPYLEKKYWIDYSIFSGTRHLAELFAIVGVSPLFNICHTIRCLPFKTNTMRQKLIESTGLSWNFHDHEIKFNTIGENQLYNHKSLFYDWKSVLLLYHKHNKNFIKKWFIAIFLIILFFILLIYIPFSGEDIEIDNIHPSEKSDIILHPL